MKQAVEIKKLKKTYPDFCLNGLNISIPSGIITGLIGENGAGKTTLIKSILGINNIEEGIINVFGKSIEDSEEFKEDIGVVLDNSFFPELLNANDIEIIMKNIYKTWDSKLYKQYLEQFKLPRNKMIKTLSKGMRKKLEIATALAHHPKLLILDEPTSGLDPVVRSEILDIFLAFIQEEDHTILLSTHITTDLEHIADELIFMDKGEIIFDKTRDEVLDSYGILKCDMDAFAKIDKKDIIRYRKNKYNYEILVENRKLAIKKYPNMIIDKANLEDIMVLYIKGVK